MATLLPRWNLSLRTELIACLLITSLASTAIVGGLAYQRLTKKFNALVMQQASKNFTADVQKYFQTYGTWAEGQKVEGFRAFSERLRPPPRPEARGGLMPPPAEPAPPAPAPAAAPGKPAPPPGGGMHKPPFRFYLFDADYRSLFTLAPYQPGDPIRDEDRARMFPILLDGRVIAYSSPDGEVNYSDLDLGYLSAMRESLVLGTAVGLTLTLLLGLFLGNRLSRSLRHLTSAVQAMGQGALRQQVPVESQNEVGVLAQAFNRMSDEIARQYEDLRQSHEKIETMAAQTVSYTHLTLPTSDLV